MKQGILAIYDREAAYACHLMEYLNQRPDFPLEARVFTSAISLGEFLEEGRADILLLGEGIELGQIPAERVGKVVRLTEGGAPEGDGECPSLYKFQPMEEMVRKLSGGYGAMRRREEPAPAEAGDRGAALIGVISPYGGSGKTTFSLALGQALAARGARPKGAKGARPESQALYVGMEEISSFPDGAQGGESLSDVLYWVKERKGAGFQGLPSIARGLGGLDCVFSPEHYGDLKSLSAEDAAFLLEEISHIGRYAWVIFDLGCWNGAVFRLLEGMERIYMPDFLRQRGYAKEAALRNVMRLTREEPLWQRIERVETPFDREVWEGGVGADRLLRTQVGQFACKLAERDFP